MPKAGTVVIGGGVSGLSVAALLATRGERVTILEQAGELGTTVRGFSREGVSFDTGLHYLGAAGEGQLLRRLIGNLLPGCGLVFEQMNVSGHDRYLFDGGEVRFCSGEERSRAALLDAFPREREAIDSYLGVLRECYPARLERLASGELTTDDALSLIGGPTLLEFLRQQTRDQSLIEALCAPCVLHGTPPESVPLFFHGAIAGTYLHSAHRIRGGGLTLVEAFIERLAVLGVEMRCGAQATAIDLSGAGAVLGVRTADGDSVSCRRCVLTGHPGCLQRLLPAGCLPRSLKRRLSRVRDTSSAYTLYGVLREPCEALAGCNLIVERGRTPARGPADQEWLAPCFISASSCANEKQGFSVIWQAVGEGLSAWEDVGHGERPSGYRVLKERALAEVESFVRSRCGHLLGDFEVVTGATPLTYRDYLGSPHGSLYGAKHVVGNSMLTPRTGIDGLYLSGQAITAPGVLGAVLSAVMVSREMEGNESMSEIWK